MLILVSLVLNLFNIFFLLVQNKQWMTQSIKYIMKCWGASGNFLIVYPDGTVLPSMGERKETKHIVIQGFFLHKLSLEMLQFFGTCMETTAQSQPFIVKQCNSYHNEI